MEEEQELPEELVDQALALSRQKFPDQPHGFPVLENFDWNAVQLPEELEQQLRDESDEDDVEALVDVTEESGFESVIGNTTLLTHRPSNTAPQSWTISQSSLPKKSRSSRASFAKSSAASVPSAKVTQPDVTPKE